MGACPRVLNEPRFVVLCAVLSSGNTVVLVPRSVGVAPRLLHCRPAVLDRRRALAGGAVLVALPPKSKPMGPQIDTNRAALERAQKRRADAVRAKELAENVINNADQEITRLTWQVSASQPNPAHRYPTDSLHGGVPGIQLRPARKGVPAR